MNSYQIKFANILFVSLMLTATAWATTINVSLQSGNSRQKLINAYNKAKSGDIVLVDTDIFWGTNDGPLNIVKSGITFKGKDRGINKYKFNRANKNKTTVLVSASDITFNNIAIIGGTIGMRIGNGTTLVKNITITNCYYKGVGYVGLDFRGRFKNVNVKNTGFEDCSFGLQTYDCAVLKGFTVSNCKFYTGDHQISLDNPNSTIIEHSNILIEKCKFYTAKRFNIALANTRNVVIDDCYMEGGSGSYSQALHIEDRTTNVLLKNSTLKCMADVAILLYATDKFGHGEGDRLTEAQKYNYGSGNLTLDNNTIQSGSADAAILVGYAKGFIKINANNVIISGNRGINSFNSASNVMFDINNNTMIKGKTYREIKNISNVVTKESYVRIR